MVFHNTTNMSTFLELFSRFVDGELSLSRELSESREVRDARDLCGNGRIRLCETIVPEIVTMYLEAKRCGGLCSRRLTMTEQESDWINTIPEAVSELDVDGAYSVIVVAMI